MSDKHYQYDSEQVPEGSGVRHEIGLGIDLQRQLPKLGDKPVGSLTEHLKESVKIVEKAAKIHVEGIEDIQAIESSDTPSPLEGEVTTVAIDVATTNPMGDAPIQESGLCVEEQSNGVKDNSSDPGGEDKGKKPAQEQNRRGRQRGRAGRGGRTKKDNSGGRIKALTRRLLTPRKPDGRRSRSLSSGSGEGTRQEGAVLVQILEDIDGLRKEVAVIKELVSEMFINTTQMKQSQTIIAEGSRNQGSNIVKMIERVELGIEQIEKQSKPKGISTDTIHDSVMGLHETISQWKDEFKAGQNMIARQIGMLQSNIVSAFENLKLPTPKELTELPTVSPVAQELVSKSEIRLEQGPVEITADLPKLAQRLKKLRGFYQISFTEWAKRTTALNDILYRKDLRAAQTKLAELEETLKKEYGKAYPQDD